LNSIEKNQDFTNFPKRMYHGNHELDVVGAGTKNQSLPREQKYADTCHTTHNECNLLNFNILKDKISFPQLHTKIKNHKH
jgi:hypothetical protein